MPDMADSHSLDLTQGPVTKKLLQFTVPILLSGILQHLYTVADRVVVGNFASNGTIALAAVGATAPATNLLLNFFNGISVGVNVVCANYRGAGQTQTLRRCMHTSVLLSVILGVILAVIGVSMAGQILTWMDTPADVLASAATYMRIYFMGMPGTLAYNCGAAILRAHGDAKRSMYILGVTGFVNVILNLVLVIGAGLDVEGVAIATIVAQYLSAGAVLWILFSPQQAYGLRSGELRIHADMLKKTVSIGLPCGINGILHSATNVLLQSSINSFDSANIIAGNTAATDINNISYLVNTAFSSACVSFSGQCWGAKAYKRVDKLAVSASLGNCGILLILATVVTLFPRQLLSIFNSDPDVVEAGIFKLLLCSWTTMFFAVSEIMIGCVRGMGKSMQPTVLNMLSLCGVRVLWILFVFPHCPHDPAYLYLCFPASWVIGMAVQISYFLHCRKKLTATERLR